jgi:CBS domain-containing protein
MKVSDMMSVNLVTCSPDQTVGDAARQMNARGVGSVLVVSGGVMTGIFTERDLVRLVANGTTPLGMVSLRDFFALSGAVLRAQGADAATTLLRAAT